MQYKYNLLGIFCAVSGDHQHDVIHRNGLERLAFQQLISIYDREGYLREALQVAKIAERFEQCSGKVEEIIERLDRIDAEANTV